MNPENERESAQSLAQLSFFNGNKILTMFKLRKFKKEDTKVVALLIKNTFKKFNGNECKERGAVQRYLDIYDLEKKGQKEILNTFKKTPIFYVAWDEDDIVGIIRGNPQRIVNLFVDGKNHKKGVGRLLINKFENEAKKQGSKEIKLRSSLYAIPFYEKMGYKKTTGIRNFHGLKTCPMKKNLE